MMLMLMMVVMVMKKSTRMYKYPRVVNALQLTSNSYGEGAICFPANLSRIKNDIANSNIDKNSKVETNN